MNRETALFFLKPDGTARRSVGASVVSRLLQLDVDVDAFCQLRPSRSFLAESHYAVHRGKPFFPWLVQFVSAGPVVAAILRGRDTIGQIRSLLGATFPEQADSDSIRGRFGIVGGVNVAHASDSPETGESETALWRPLIEREIDRSPDAATYVDLYTQFERVDTEDYREISQSASEDRTSGIEAHEAFLGLLRRESDLATEVLSRIATAMVDNALARRS